METTVDVVFSHRSVEAVRTREMRTQGFIPSLSTPEDAASFENSVLPFYHVAIEHISEYLNPSEIYSTTNPFILGSVLSVVSSFTVFVISLSTGNWSWCFLEETVFLTHQGRPIVGNYPRSLQLPLPHVCRLARLTI